MEQEQKNNQLKEPFGQQPQQEVDQSVLLAAICYGILPPIAVAISLVMLAFKKDDSFIVFHAKQGLVFGIFGSIAMIIPFGGTALAFIGFPIVAILAITHVFKKELWKMPIVAEVAAMIGI